MRLRAILVLGVILGVLGVVFVITSRPDPEPLVVPRPLVWSVEMDDLRSMAISLPLDGKSQAWIKRGDRGWHFDQPNGPKVNARRWGGGVPLLLSGPGAERLIAAEASAGQLENFGLDDPRMKIHLVLENDETIDIDVGDSTPDGRAYYVRLAGSTDVYTVHHAWHAVLERLVLNPPYPEPNEN